MPAILKDSKARALLMYAYARKKAVEKYFEKKLKKGVDIWGHPCYYIAKQGRNGSTSPILKWGGDTMTVSEIFGLLTLLAVVIFGVIEAAKK